MSKRVFLLFTICYTLILTIFSLVAIGSLPKIGTNHDDKIFHILAYSVLLFLWYFTLTSLKKTKPLFLAILFSVTYGIIIEVLQGQITIVRQFDLLDVLANCIGVMIASLFLILRNRLIVKNL